MVDLGKPAPESDGKIRVDFASRLAAWPLANGTYDPVNTQVGFPLQAQFGLRLFF